MITSLLCCLEFCAGKSVEALLVDLFIVFVIPHFKYDQFPGCWEIGGGGQQG